MLFSLCSESARAREKLRNLRSYLLLKLKCVGPNGIHYSFSIADEYSVVTIFAFFLSIFFLDLK